MPLLNLYYEKCPQQNGGGFIGPRFMVATTDQNLIAEQTNVVHHNFFSDLMMLIHSLWQKRFIYIIAIFVPKSLSLVFI